MFWAILALGLRPFSASGRVVWNEVLPSPWEEWLSLPVWYAQVHATGDDRGINPPKVG